MFFEQNSTNVMKDGIIIQPIGKSKSSSRKKVASAQIIFDGLLEVDIESNQKVHCTC